MRCRQFIAMSIALGSISLAASRVRADGPASRFDPADMVKEDPAPGRETVPPMKPFGCDLDHRQDARDLGGRASYALKDHRDYAIPDAIVIACGAPDDPNVQQQVAYLVQRWVNLTELSPRTAVAGIKARMHGDAFKAAIGAHCKTLADGDAEESASAKEIRLEIKQATGCGDLSGAPEWWNDRRAAPISQLVAAQSFLNHVRELARVNLADPTELRLILPYAVYGLDGRRLDAAQFDKELAASGWNDAAKQVARETFESAKNRDADWQRTIATLSKKDPAFKQLLIDVPEKAWTAWEVTRAANASTFDDGDAFEIASEAPSLSSAKGCAATLRPHVAALMKAAKVADVTAATKAIGEGPVAYPLLERYAFCEAIEGNPAYASALFNLLGKRHYRGPRTAASYAVLDALAAIKADRPKFVFEVDSLRSFEIGLQIRASDLTANHYADRDAAGVVASVKKSGDSVLVTFKREAYTEPDYACKKNNRIASISANGQVVYDEDCVQTGSHQVDTTPEPELVRATFAAGISAGHFLDAPGIGGELVDGHMMAVPRLVFANKSQKQLVAFYGFEL